jgi:hypothetical protein
LWCGPSLIFQAAAKMPPLPCPVAALAACCHSPFSLLLTTCL